MDEGAIIRYLRVDRGITQIALAEGCCSTRHLRDIEKGLKEPSYRLFCQIMNKMDVDIHTVVNEDIRKYGIALFRKIEQIERDFLDWKYCEVKRNIDEIMSTYFLESGLGKKLKYYSAVCIWELEEDYKKTKKMLLSIIEVQSILEIDDYLKVFRDKIDINVINALAVNESYSGKKKRACEIFKKLQVHLIKYVGNETIFEIRNLYNISKCLYELFDFEGSIGAGLSTLKLCHQLKVYDYMPGAHYYLGKSYYAMDLREEAFRNYKKYIYLRCLFDDKEKIAERWNVVDDNKLELDMDILRYEY